MDEREARRRCLLLARSSTMSPELLKELCCSASAGPVLAKWAEAEVGATDEQRNALCEELASWQLERALPGGQGSSSEAYRVAREHEAQVYGRDMTATSFAYGELDPRSYLKLWRCARKIFLDHNEAETITVFDVGSGRGLVAMMAALVEKRVHAVGVEVVPGLHEQAYCLLKRLTRQRPEAAQRVRLVQGDIREEVAWATQPGVAMVNWTCFDQDLVASLTIIAERLTPPGSVVVTLSTAVQSAAFVVAKKIQLETHWGVTPCYVHVKLTDEQIARRLGPNGTPTMYDGDQAIATFEAAHSDTMDSMENNPPSEATFEAVRSDPSDGPPTPPRSRQYDMGASSPYDSALMRRKQARTSPPISPLDEDVVVASDEESPSSAPLDDDVQSPPPQKKKAFFAPSSPLDAALRRRKSKRTSAPPPLADLLEKADEEEDEELTPTATTFSPAAAASFATVTRRRERRSCAENTAAHTFRRSFSDRDLQERTPPSIPSIHSPTLTHSRRR